MLLQFCTHCTCSLMQWLAHNKTCPQCREKCLQRNVIRLYIDTSDTSSQPDVELDPEEMKVNGPVLALCVCVCVCLRVIAWGYITFLFLCRRNLLYKNVT